MRTKKYIEHGQAILELVMLLFGFTVVFLGLVFISGLADGDLNALLTARNEAELAASNYKGQPMGSPPEFGFSSRYRPDIYNNSDSLDFSPMDRPGYIPGNTIGIFPAAFADTSVSLPDETHNSYFLQAKMDAWKNMNHTAENVFKADFVPDLSSLNARGAADLVAGRAQNISSVTTLNSSHHEPGSVNALYKTFRRLFGVRISPDTVEKAPGNVVYMPVFSR